MAKKMNLVGFSDPQKESAALDAHAKKLNDYVLVSQAFHALFTTFQKHNIATDELSSAYYIAYQKLISVIPLDYVYPPTSLRQTK